VEVELAPQRRGGGLLIGRQATNENTNGLLRQYFPKSTDLAGYHGDYLEFVAAQLNNRPRKRPHGGRTPAEVLDQLLSDKTTRPVLH
jgi:IS30 family transposase